LRADSPYARFTKLAEVGDAYLKEGWSQDCIEGEVIESTIESVTDTWTVHQIYGLAEVNGERKHVIRVVGKKGNQVERLRMVYDWKA